MQAVITFLRSEEAATAVEYAVMLGLILAMIIAAIGSVGAHTGGMWGNIDSEMQGHGIN
jgi:pilus assembly protein Flp/PilA